MLPFRLFSRRLFTSQKIFCQRIPSSKITPTFFNSLSIEDKKVLQDYLAKDNKKNSDKKLSSKELRGVALQNAIPFIGFGFFDNFIMILAGDYIETSFGQALVISTMAAAAIGNLVSDVCGVILGDYIDALVNKMGVPFISLTLSQLSQLPVRLSIAVGKMLGVSLGCTIGMVPLLF